MIILKRISYIIPLFTRLVNACDFLFTKNADNLLMFSRKPLHLDDSRCTSNQTVNFRVNYPCNSPASRFSKADKYDIMISSRKQ